MSVDINYGFLEVLSVFSQGFLFLFVLLPFPRTPCHPLRVGYISQMSDGSLLSSHINYEVLELIGSSMCLCVSWQFLNFIIEWL